VKQKFGRADAAVAVNLLLEPQLRGVLEHPSWSIGAKGVLKSPASIAKSTGNWAELLGVRPNKCERMHDLRKAIRELRYSIEGAEAAFMEHKKAHKRLLEARNMLVDRQKVLRDREYSVRVTNRMADTENIPCV
jgi:CHAD domain-containing protein